jgi:hypothetical protein
MHFHFFNDVKNMLIWLRKIFGLKQVFQNTLKLRKFQVTGILNQCIHGMNWCMIPRICALVHRMFEPVHGGDLMIFWNQEHWWINTWNNEQVHNPSYGQLEPVHRLLRFALKLVDARNWWSVYIPCLVYRALGTAPCVEACGCTVWLGRYASVVGAIYPVWSMQP